MCVCGRQGKKGLDWMCEEKKGNEAVYFISNLGGGGERREEEKGN